MMLRITALAGLAALLVSTAAPAAASDRDDVVAVIQAHNDAGNRGDRAAYAAACAPDATFIDHVAPYVFAPPNACANEYDAVVAFGAANHVDIMALSQKIGDPVFFERTGDRAYAVFPVTARFSQRGVKMIEKLTLTAILRRETDRWRIIHLSYGTFGWGPIKGR